MILECADLRDVAISDASVVTLNFTLQFVPEDGTRRPGGAYFPGLRPGGALILSEKIRFPEADEQSLQETLHYDFKRANGYSELEISQKRSSLERVLVPETVEAHKARLLKAGFAQVIQWHQCFNFVSLLAVRAP